MGLRINRVNNILNSFGFELTPKSQMLPKDLLKYFDFTYCDHTYKPTTKDKFNNVVKYFLEKIFPKYIPETNNERTSRIWCYADSCILEDLTNNKIKYLEISKKELKEMNKLDYYDQMEFAKKLQEAGRVKDVKILDTNGSIPEDAVDRAKTGEFWSLPTKLINIDHLKLVTTHRK